VLDAQDLILGEYLRNLSRRGQPGVGDAFLKWILTNQWNPNRCALVHIHALEGDGRGFEEFPQDLSLDGFDRDDRVFVAVALAHPERPPILEATDTDWWHYRQALRANGVAIKFLCVTEIRRRP